MAKLSTKVCTGLVLVVLVLWRDLIALSRTLLLKDWNPRGPDRGIAAVNTSRGSVRSIGHPNTSTDWAVKMLEERINDLTQEVERHFRNAASQQEVGPAKDVPPLRTGTAKDSNIVVSREPSLPMCDVLMQRTDGVYADGNFLSSPGTRVRWAIRSDGSRELQYPDLCHMRRYTAREAHQCLSGLHMSMIGDSLTRYQYLSLAYLLERGEFPPRFARWRGECKYVNETGHPVCSPPDQPNFCVEGEWGNWKRYNTGLGGGDDGGVMNGRLECRSYRATGKEKGESSDNILYRAAGSGVVLSYLSEVGWGNSPTPLHGFYFTNCTMDGSCRRTEQDNLVLANRSNQSDFDWSQPFPEAILGNGTIRTVLPRPDVALYNRGIWGSLSADRAKLIFPALYDWVGGNDTSPESPPTTAKGRCYFKSTTANYRSIRKEQGKNEWTNVRPHAYDAGCSYLDFAHLTGEFAYLHSGDSKSTEKRSVFWDAVHFQPWVYEELNQVLLNTLCNLGSRAEAE